VCSALKKFGFKFAGSTICYALMQALSILIGCAIGFWALGTTGVVVVFAERAKLIVLVSFIG
jgi:hypothetical protein